MFLDQGLKNMEAFSPGMPGYPPPWDILVGFPYWDVGENGLPGYVMLLPHAPLPLTQVTHARSQEAPNGNVETM